MERLLGDRKKTMGSFKSGQEQRVWQTRKEQDTYAGGVGSTGLFAVIWASAL
jgi:hypothetical protein